MAFFADHLGDRDGTGDIARRVKKLSRAIVLSKPDFSQLKAVKSQPTITAEMDVPTEIRLRNGPELVSARTEGQTTNGVGEPIRLRGVAVVIPQHPAEPFPTVELTVGPADFISGFDQLGTGIEPICEMNGIGRNWILITLAIVSNATHSLPSRQVRDFLVFSLAHA